MRTPLTLLASAALIVPLAVAAPAAAAPAERKPACPETVYAGAFAKIIDVRPGGVGKATKKRPYGSLTGRYTKKVTPEASAEYWKPVGKKKTVAFAKNAVICILVPTDVNLIVKKVGLKSLRQAVNNPVMNPQWGLRFNAKGRVKMAYQIYAP